ncbi:hypothetical protein [Deinococcus sp.]|uniref:hypothetical protein n=1 Tax=Deinococcus sp. TaxID=47478 RepID=UPI00286980F5|nr:hypothetical protein [Deinococcus sp.]
MTATLDPDPAPTRWAGATDAAVLQALAERDEDAARELHRRYARVIYALAFRAGAINSDVDVQRAFVAMARHAEQRAQSRLDARLWILGTAYQALFVLPRAEKRF